MFLVHFVLAQQRDNKNEVKATSQESHKFFVRNKNPRHAPRFQACLELLSRISVTAALPEPIVAQHSPEIKTTSEHKKLSSGLARINLNFFHGTRRGNLWCSKMLDDFNVQCEREGARMSKLFMWTVNTTFVRAKEKYLFSGVTSTPEIYYQPFQIYSPVREKVPTEREGVMWKPQTNLRFSWPIFGVSAVFTAFLLIDF